MKEEDAERGHYERAELTIRYGYKKETARPSSSQERPNHLATRVNHIPYKLTKNVCVEIPSHHPDHGFIFTTVDFHHVSELNQ